MARPLRIEYEGALYHVTARGNEHKYQRGQTYAIDKICRKVKCVGLTPHGLARTDGIGIWGFGYDAESRLLSVDGPWENDTVMYVYDDNGRRTSIQPQGGETVGYGYDALDRLTAVTPGTRSFVYAYPTGSSTPLPERLTRPNGSFTTYQFNALNHLTEVANRNSTQQLIFSDAFTYNAKDMRDTETVTNGAPISNFTANLTTYTYNNINQLFSTTAPAQAFAYDADGNMTTGYTPEGYQFTATYDGENRLKSFDYTDSQSVAHHADFHYSADRFLAKQVVDGVETRFVRRGYSLLQERDSSNSIIRSYVWDSRSPGGIGGLLELAQGGQKYSYFYGGKGSVRGLLDESQSVTVAYTYDEFGNLMVKSGTLDQPFQFSTKEYGEETGLSYYGYRFYSPGLGRWINRDPIGLGGGDLNLYGFVRENPINFVDPLGEKIDLSKAGCLIEVLNIVKSTKRGMELYNILESRPETYRIFEGPPGTTPGYNEYTRIIRVTPSLQRKIEVLGICHKIDASLERQLAHEMGHAADDDLEEMENIMLNENPVASELGQPIRTSY